MGADRIADLKLFCYDYGLSSQNGVKAHYAQPRGVSWCGLKIKYAI